MKTLRQHVADAYTVRGGGAELARRLSVSHSTLTRVLAGATKPSADLLAEATRCWPDLDLHGSVAEAVTGAVLDRGDRDIRAVWADGEVRLRQGGRWTWVDGVKQRIPWGRAYRLLGEARSCAEWREGVRDEG